MIVCYRVVSLGRSGSPPEVCVRPESDDVTSFHMAYVNSVAFAVVDIDRSIFAFTEESVSVVT